MGAVGTLQARLVPAAEWIWRLAEQQHGVVGRRQLWARGVLDQELDHRVRTGLLVPLSADVLRIAGAPLSEPAVAMSGVLDSPGHAYLSHASAAAWWGLPGFHLRSPVHTVIPRQGTTARQRLSVVHYHSDLPIDHLNALRGVPVVSPSLTIFLLAGTEHPRRTERALDNAWSMRLVTHQSLAELLTHLAARGRNGIRLMRRLLAERSGDYVAPASGLEARVGRLARDAGIELRRQVDSGGEEWVGRVDFRVEGTGKVIEVLSERYHRSHLDASSDESRFTRLARAGFDVLTIWDSDVWEDGEGVVDRIQAFSRGDPTR